MTVQYSDKYEKASAVKRANREARYERIRQRFNEKYHIQRQRLDDVIAELAQEFTLAPSTIQTALKSPSEPIKKTPVVQGSLAFS
jgi:hypothetical protein